MGNLPAKSPEGCRLPRAVGVVAVLVGVLSFKLATAAGLLQGDVPCFSVVWSLLCGFGVEAVVAAVVLALSSKAPRAASVVGLVVGVVCALQVYFALTFGGPATWHLLSYRSAVDASLLVPSTIAATVGAVVAVVVAAFALRRASPRVLAIVIGLLIVAAGIGRVVDDGTQKRLGLSRSPVLALLPVATRADVAGHDDDHSDGEDVAARSAPVTVLDHAPKHVVLFVSESTADRFVDVDTMPTLISLASDHGLRFVDHVAESPVSIKALFSLLCGLPPLPESALETTSIPRIDCRSLPETLSAAGFDAGLFHGGYFAFTDKLAFFNERGFSRLVDGESVTDSATHWHNGWGVDDRAIVDDALAFLDNRADRNAPSLVVVVPLIPHYEYFLPDDAPRPFGNKDLVARYKNGLRFADVVLARLVEGYKARGLYDDSVFVVVGDHGEAFDEHPRNRLHGGFLYEENLRAPLIIHSPRALPPGAQTSSRPSTHADVMATILDLVDVAMPARSSSLTSIGGQSVIASSYTPRASVHFTSYPDRRIAWRGPRLKLIADDDGTELFDLRLDPRERRVVDDEAAAATLRSRAETVLAERTAVLKSAPVLDDGYLARAARVAGLALKETRVFNMARRCIPFRSSATDDVVVTLPALSPPATVVGFGIDDGSRQQRRGALHATIASNDAVIGTVDVDSVFERSSMVLRTSPLSSLTITIAPSAKTPSGCLWVTP